MFNLPKNSTLEEMVNSLKSLQNQVKELVDSTKVRILYYPGDELQVRLGSEIYILANPTSELYKEVNKAVEAQDFDLVRRLMEVKKTANPKETVKNAKALLDTGDFTIEGNLVFLKGVKRSLPVDLVTKFAEAVGNPELYDSLKNFWYWVVLNPNTRIQEELFKFITVHGFRLMQNGFLLAYRWVARKAAKNDLAEFISNQYIRVKKNKKSPKNYSVYNVEGSNYVCIDENQTTPPKEAKLVGNLYKMYVSIDEYQVDDAYTDGHTRTFNIKLGTEVTQERMDCCEDKKRDCASGLHFASNLKDYSSFGNTALLVAVNPRNIVSVPESTSTKARCCAYMPLAALESEDYKLLDDVDVMDLLEEYSDAQFEELETLARENKAEDLRKNYLIPSMEQEEFVDIVNILSQRINSF